MQAQCVPKRCLSATYAFPVGVVDTCGDEHALPPYMSAVDTRLRTAGVINGAGGVRVDQTCVARCFTGFSHGETLLSQMGEDFVLYSNFTYACAGRLVDGAPVETICDVDFTTDPTSGDCVSHNDTGRAGKNLQYLRSD
jgi:hypothetical protein